MINLKLFAKLRREFGQKKYGAGRANAGWQRDNGRDVLEELHDGIVITEYWYKRLAETMQYTPRLGVEIGAFVTLVGVLTIYSALHLLLWTVNLLRSLGPTELREETNVKRAPETTEVEN